MLYSNDLFMKAFYDSLSEDGILVMQLGQSPEHVSANEANTIYKNRLVTTDLLSRVGFESIHAFEEVRVRQNFSRRELYRGMSSSKSIATPL